MGGRPASERGEPSSALEQPTTVLDRVEVRRSARRQRTVTAFRESGALVVCIPAAFSRTEERDWVPRMVERLQAQEARRRPDDAALARRAAELSARHLGGRARASSVRWVANQQARWGSTSTADGAVRLSDRLRGMPSWVIDYVLVHELAHLIEHGHDDAFWALVGAYPRAERARGYLEGFAAAVRAAGDAAPDGDADDVDADRDGADDGADDDAGAEGGDVDGGADGARWAAVVARTDGLGPGPT